MRLRHVLVVEDADEDFETVQDAARHCALPNPIVRAASGGECLRQLRLLRLLLDGKPVHDAEILPLMVLLDLNTPGDDGRDVLREVRGDAALCALPLVVLSASANPLDVQVCYAHGANAYHVKPVNHVSHLKLLQTIFTYWLGSVVLPA